jgi:hypothetical protein
MPTLRMPAASGLVVGLCILGLTVGCSSLGADRSRAGFAAQRFHEALAAGNAAAACDLLAPETRKELEALTDAKLPQAVSLSATDVYGTNAVVVLGSDTSREADTVFLARFGRLWKVTAAGCKPRADLPYDCDVKGS